MPLICIGATDTVQLDIQAADIVKVKAHLSNKLPVIFVETTADCTKRIQASCSMDKNIGPFYDPDSKGRLHNYATNYTRFPQGCEKLESANVILLLTLNKHCFIVQDHVPVPSTNNEI